MSHRKQQPKRAPRAPREVVPHDAESAAATWGTYTDDEGRAAVEAFEPFAERADHFNVVPIVQSYFEQQAAGSLPAGALVFGAITGLQAAAINGEATVRQVHGIATAVLGRPDDGERLDLADFSHAGLVPSVVYRNLPKPLRECCSHFRPDFERDVFLTGALAAMAACLPNVLFRYGHAWQGLNLYTCVVAESGAGKGAFALANGLSQHTDAYLNTESEEALKFWEDAQETEEVRKSVPKKAPVWRRLDIAANTSEAEIILALHAGHGHGLIYETEIKTLFNALGRDWSGFRPVLLAAWPNETIKVDRKDQRPLRIKQPTLSIALSGTEGSFAEWIVDVEDGLFNRTAFYSFQAIDDFANQFHEDQDRQLDAHIDALGRLLLSAYKSLMGRRADGGEREPLYLRFTPEQQQRLNHVFGEQKRTMLALGLRQLASYTHRTAVMALRIAGALTLVRRVDEGAWLGGSTQSIFCDDRDFVTGLQLVLTYLAHGVELARRLPSPKTGLVERRKGGLRKFFDALAHKFGDRPFERHEAVALAPELGIGLRSADRYLAQLNDSGLLTKQSDGTYYRSPLAPPVTPAVERAAAGPPVPIGYAAPDLVTAPEVEEGANQEDAPELGEAPY